VIQHIGGGRKVDLGPGRAAASLRARVQVGGLGVRLTSDPLAQGPSNACISKLKGMGDLTVFSIKRRAT
jgi:hypothetical protein